MKLVYLLVEREEILGYYLAFHFNSAVKYADKNIEEGLKYYELLQKSESSYKYLANYMMEDSNAEGGVDRLKEHLLKAYEMGNPLAKREYAICLVEGRYFEKNIKKSYEIAKELFLSDDYLYSSIFANNFFIEKIENNDGLKLLFERFKKCADEANFSAMCYYTYYIGINHKKLTEKEAVKYLMRAAEKEYFTALYELGRAYSYENVLPTIKVDYKKGFEMFEKSDKSPKSQLQLGHCYYEARGVKQDYKKAFECYDKAYPSVKKAGLYLGKAYLFGHGVKKNNKKAMEYFNEVEELGGYTSFFIGTIYHDGIEGFLEPDIKKAMKLYKLALKNYQETPVYIRIGNIHYSNKEYKKAVDNYSKALALDSKNAVAHYNLGNVYSKDDNIDKEYRLAIKHYEASYNLGDMDAALQVGSMYFFNQYKMVDEQKAFKYFTIAYDNKVEDAEVYLAHWHEYCKKDEQKAYELIKDSKSENHIKYSTLGNIYYNGVLLGRDYKKAFEYYQKSYEIFQENSYIWFRLGRCYYFGNGVERDTDRAYDFISQAKEDGNQEAAHFYEEYFKNR